MMHRAVVGAAIGFGFFALDAVAALVRVALNPSIAVSAGAVLTMLLFMLVFLAAGALAGWLWRIRFTLVRFVAIGTLAGATVWSYLTVTWPLTARAGAVLAPQTSVLDSVLIGAGGGALGGALLFAIGTVRRLLRG